MLNERDSLRKERYSENKSEKNDISMISNQDNSDFDSKSDNEIIDDTKDTTEVKNI